MQLQIHASLRNHVPLPTGVQAIVLASRQHQLAAKVVSLYCVLPAIVIPGIVLFVTPLLVPVTSSVLFLVVSIPAGLLLVIGVSSATWMQMQNCQHQLAAQEALPPPCNHSLRVAHIQAQECDSWMGNLHEPTPPSLTIPIRVKVKVRVRVSLRIPTCTAPRTNEEVGPTSPARSQGRSQSSQSPTCEQPLTQFPLPE